MATRFSENKVKEWIKSDLFEANIYNWAAAAGEFSEVGVSDRLAVCWNMRGRLLAIEAKGGDLSHDRHTKQPYVRTARLSNAQVQFGVKIVCAGGLFYRIGPMEALRLPGLLQRWGLPISEAYKERVLANRNRALEKYIHLGY